MRSHIAAALIPAMRDAGRATVPELVRELERRNVPGVTRSKVRRALERELGPAGENRVRRQGDGNAATYALSKAPTPAELEALGMFGPSRYWHPTKAPSGAQHRTLVANLCRLLELEVPATRLELEQPA